MTLAIPNFGANPSEFDITKLGRIPKTLTAHKPLYPPVRILTGQCEGIEPLRLPAYVRRVPGINSGD